MADRADQNGSDPIDVHVGLRIRSMRRQRSMTQDALAKSIGVTFQQVQKYERGTNRISASMLVRTARALGCAVSSLLPPSEEAESPVLPPIPHQVMRLVGTIRGVEELVQAFGRIASQEEREEVLRLAAVLAKRPG